MHIKQVMKNTLMFIVLACVTVTLVGCQSSETDASAKVSITPAKTPEVSTPVETPAVPTPFPFDSVKAGELITVLEVPIGNEDGSLAYGGIGDNGMVQYGPSDFAVADNGDIYVLDNYHGDGADRVCVFSEGRWVRNIDYSNFVTYGTRIAICDGSLYVFDSAHYAGTPYIVKMTLKGVLQKEYMFRGEAINIQKLTVIDGEIVVISLSSRSVLDDATQSAVKADITVGEAYVNPYQREVTFGSTSWIIQVEDDGRITHTPIGKTDNGGIYIVCWDSGCIYQYESSGEPSGVVCFGDLLKDTVYIDNSIVVAADGTLYIMVAHPDAVRMYKADFS